MTYTPYYSRYVPLTQPHAEKKRPKGLSYRDPDDADPFSRIGVWRRVWCVSGGNCGKGTEFAEIATQFKDAYLVHGAIYSSGYMPFSNGTTNISKSRDTVGHETTSLQNTVTPLREMQLQLFH